jgi:antitoxin ParD1/3/4
VATTVTVAVPAPLQEWIEEQVQSGEYSDAGDYLRDLIEIDRQRHAALVEGEKGGISTGSIREIIADAKSKLRIGEARADRRCRLVSG